MCPELLTTFLVHQMWTLAGTVRSMLLYGLQESEASKLERAQSVISVFSPQEHACTQIGRLMERLLPTMDANDESKLVTGLQFFYAVFAALSNCLASPVRSCITSGKMIQLETWTGRTFRLAYRWELICALGQLILWSACSKQLHLWTAVRRDPGTLTARATKSFFVHVVYFYESC